MTNCAQMFTVVKIYAQSEDAGPWHLPKVYPAFNIQLVKFSNSLLSDNVTVQKFLILSFKVFLDSFENKYTNTMHDVMKDN